MVYWEQMLRARNALMKTVFAAFTTLLFLGAYAITQPSNKE